MIKASISNFTAYYKLTLLERVSLLLLFVTFSSFSAFYTCNYTVFRCAYLVIIYKVSRYYAYSYEVESLLCPNETNILLFLFLLLKICNFLQMLSKCFDENCRVRLHVYILCIFNFFFIIKYGYR